MPWPNDVVTRTATGTYTTATGSAAVGRVTFTPTARVVDTDDNIIVEDTITAILNASGTFSVVLPTTDNSLLKPAGWAYQVHVRIRGVKPQKFFAFLPAGDGSPVDLNKELSGTGNVADATAPTSVRGPIGPRGPGTITGAGLPVHTDGFDNDVYIDTDTGYYYGPKAGGEWPGVPFYTAGTTTRHVHTQSSASATWTINHLLGGKPSVTIVDSAETVVVGDVVYNSNTSVTISFTAPFSGFAYLT